MGSWRARARKHWGLRKASYCDYIPHFCSGSVLAILYAALTGHSFSLLQTFDCVFLSVLFFPTFYFFMLDFFSVVYPSTLFLLTYFSGNLTLQFTSTLDFDCFCALFSRDGFCMWTLCLPFSAFRAVLWLWNPASAVPNTHSLTSFLKVSTPLFSDMFF